MNSNIVIEDVVEEHNGVYGDKWHIISPEGFDLPEGLDYLKNSWEGDDWLGRVRIHKYVANIKVSGIPLKNAFEGLSSVLGEFKAYDTNFEINNCTDNSKGIKTTLSGVVVFAKNFFVHGCPFKDLVSIMCGACIMCEAYKKGNCYNLSENVFTDMELRQWERLRYYLERIKVSKIPFKIFDLRGCNFSVTKKESLMQVAGSLNLLI